MEVKVININEEINKMKPSHVIRMFIDVTEMALDMANHVGRVDDEFINKFKKPSQNRVEALMNFADGDLYRCMYCQLIELLPLLQVILNRAEETEKLHSIPTTNPQ